MTATTKPVDLLAVIESQSRKWGDHPNANALMNAHAAFAELIARDEQAQSVFDCILRGISDLRVSPRFQSYAPGWLESWGRSMLAAGFRPTNPEARDIQNGLAAIQGENVGGEDA